MISHGTQQPAGVRAAAACSPMGELECVIAEAKGARTWFVVRPHDEVVPRYEKLGLTLEPGCRVVVDARTLQPVGVLPAVDPTPSSAIGFNPYFDLPPA